MSVKVCELCGGTKAVGTYRYREGHLTLCYDCRRARSRKVRSAYFIRAAEFSPSQARNIIHSRGGACEWCKDTANLEVHHIVRLVDGGTHDPSNLIVLCAKCHHSVAHRGDQRNGA